jgi:hypothetical protein
VCWSQYGASRGFTATLLSTFRAALGAISMDTIAVTKAEQLAMGGLRINTRDGHMDRGNHGSV